MANIASQIKYQIPYGSTTRLMTTTLDQVDNSTRGTAEQIQFFKLNVNRMNEKYHREDERLRTFSNWPVPFLDKHTLAQTGMFFTNEDDKVKCYFCEVEIGRWEREDQPVPEHLRWSPNCPLLRRRTTNNVPINPEALDALLPPISYDICGSNNPMIEVHENAYSEGRQSIQSTNTSLNTNSADVAGVVNASLPTEPPCSRPGAATNSGGTFFPEYPEYAIETARLRSFEDWPRNMKQKPQQLAEAGFFYTGVGDRVRCFSCGGGLKDWDDQDEPWEQHALWLSQCRFVKLIKGQLYLDAVAKKAADARENSQKAAAIEEEQQRQQLAAIDASSNLAAVEATNNNNNDEQQQEQEVSIESGDVAPTSTTNTPTAASRIYEKIVAQGCSEGSGSEKTALREEKLCKICYADEYNTAFLPCGHVVACAKCASSVTKCPLCRKPFTDVMRVYFS